MQSSKTKYEYDARNRLARVTANYNGTPGTWNGIALNDSDVVVQYTYDGDNNMLTSTAPFRGLETPATTSFQYDSANRLVTVTAPAPASGQSQPTSTYTYDALGRSISFQDPNGGAFNMNYDSRDNLTKQTGPNGWSASTTFTKADFVSSLTDANGKQTDYLYDAAGRLIQIIDPLVTGEATRGTRQFQYDVISNVTSMIDQENRVTNYTYNSRRWLYESIAPYPDASNTSTGRPTTTTTYFANGQVKDTTEKITSTDSRTTQYAYDGAGRLFSITAPPNSSNTSGVTRYHYDGLGQLDSVTDARNFATTYAYDGMGRLFRTTSPAPTSGATQPEAVNVYNSRGNVILQKDPEDRRST